MGWSVRGILQTTSVYSRNITILPAVSLMLVAENEWCVNINYRDCLKISSVHGSHLPVFQAQ
jgi:hypothetical protein